MSKKQTAAILLASIALLALLGCVEPPVTPECKGEGETIPVIASPPQCCSGLTLIPPKEPDLVGISGYCTAKCGNGTCDAIESAYNCPADCVAQPAEPEYYDDEPAAFDALGKDLDELPELSPEELDAILGE